MVAVVAGVIEARASSSSASEAPTASSTPRVGHVATPSWRRSAADTERSMVASNTAPTPEEGWEARTQTWLTNNLPENYLPGPMPVVDTTPTSHWTPSLPKAKAATEGASAKAASRPTWTPESRLWQEWQDSIWWDDTSVWRSGQRRGRGPYGRGGEGDKGKK